jgi:hypothetical protein
VPQRFRLGATRRGCRGGPSRFDTDRIAERGAIVDRWAAAIGTHRTARWGILGADRDRPGRHVAVVEFPSYTEVMANSRHPAGPRQGRRSSRLSGCFWPDYGPAYATDQQWPLPKAIYRTGHQDRIRENAGAPGHQQLITVRANKVWRA